ncbi:MAG: anti-sigma F factor [Clostridia bacterium]|nr:anti-sigma F factor [Clostridia bacterium]
MQEQVAMNRAVVEFDSVDGNLGFARVAAASFAAQLDFTVDELEDIKLAVSEAVSNCIVHAYPNAIGRVRMSLESSHGHFALEIEDWGTGIADIAEARLPGRTTCPERIGMGFTLMEALSLHLEVESELGRGTRVRMAFAPDQA